MSFPDSYGQLPPYRADTNTRHIRRDGGRLIVTRRLVRLEGSLDQETQYRAANAVIRRGKE